MAAEETQHAEHAHPNYVKVWGILVVLLIISILGPMVGVRQVTLITAFGIAIIKAFMVAKNFMHLNIEARYVIYILITMLAFMILLFTFVSPDVMRHEGRRWKNDAAEAEVERAEAAAGAAGHESKTPAPAGEGAER